MKTRLQGFPVKTEWDGYFTVSARTAAKISTTGKTPKPGYEVKTILHKTDINGKPDFYWLSRTVYHGVAKYYIY